MARHESGVRDLARMFGVEDRVVYLEAGHLPSLLARAAGVVTVNSTVGAAALEHGCRTIALSAAVYHLEGLTFQGTLDEFWQGAAPPDPLFFRQFKTAVVHATQINGGFYCAEGIALASRHAADRMERDRSVLEEYA
ncbi:Capsule polysaccharide biosynthesis protein [compost metagenome]